MVRNCKFCGKAFETGRGKPTKYCSEECRKLGGRERNRQYYLKHRKRRLDYSRDYYRKYVRPYKKRRNCTNKHDCLNCPETEDCVYALENER